MRRKKPDDQATGSSARLAPADIQQIEFRLAFRGYNERDVDAFLDRITEDLTFYIEENRRLRGGSGLPAPTDASAEAERIIAEARAEAARIVRDGQMGAAAAGVGGAEARAAVAPFLSSEREFLQSLGGLVQAHAEEIKEMVASFKAQAEATGAERPTEVVAPAVAEAASGPEPAVAGLAAEPAPTEEPTAPEPASAEEPTAPEPLTVDEPEVSGRSEEPTEEEAFAPITVPDADADEAPEMPEPAPVTLRKDSGERSLRELFWGED